jgi:hypothetical protein
MTGPDLAVFDGSDPKRVRGDAVLARRALRAGWLNQAEGKRQRIQEQGWNMAGTCADTGDVKGFAAVTAVCEKMYQADVKRHEQERDDIPEVAPMVIESRTVAVANIDERKRQLAERIARLAGDGDNGRGSSLSGGDGSGT